MARVTYGALVDELKGSIGGLTFQNNVSGSIVRMKPTRRKPIRNKQQFSLSSGIEILRHWQNLTIIQQLAWNTFADTNPYTDKFGRVKTISGINYFLNINSLRKLLSLNIILVPPVYSAAPTNLNYTVSISEISINLILPSPDSTPNSALLIWTTPPITESSDNIERQIRFTHLINTLPYCSIDLTSYWENAHGISYPPSTKPYNFNIFVLFQIVNTSSFIASEGSIISDSLNKPAYGIGFMAIDSTNIVG